MLFSKLLYLNSIPLLQAPDADPSCLQAPDAGPGCLQPWLHVHAAFLSVTLTQTMLLFPLQAPVFNV